MNIATPIFCAEQDCVKSGSAVTLSGTPALGHMSFSTAEVEADVSLTDGDDVIVSLFDNTNHALYRAAYNTGTLTLNEMLQESGSLQDTGLLVASVGISLAAFGPEAVYSLTGDDVNHTNGTIQRKVLSAIYTPTFSLEAGRSVLLILENADAYTVTWSNVDKWYGGTPAYFGSNLTGDDAFVFWHDGTSLCATYAGGYSA